MRCISDCVRLDLCVCHAPHRGRGESECTLWRGETDHLLAKFASQDLPLVLLSDANARVGGHDSAHIGDLAAEEFDVNGSGLRDLLCKRALWMPSTFAQCHVGETHTFIAVRDHSLHRNDFVAVLVGWGFEFVVQFWVEYTVDIGQKSPDHFPAVLDCRMPFGRVCRRG